MKTCAQCFGPFHAPGRARALYCSDECRHEHARLRRESERVRRLAAPLKTCSRCSAELAKGEFDADQRRLDGLFPYCKGCRRAYNGSLPRRAGPAKPPAIRSRDYYGALSAAERTSAARKRHLWSTYRLTTEDYDRLLAAQRGLCAICGREETRGSSKFGTRGRLAVDHDHTCCPGRKSCGACVRGLLCMACNTAIASLDDDPARIHVALMYVTAGPGQQMRLIA